ncbi:MAG: hypothetical protein R3270_07890 [Gammaproteobacteria bacterium]|nr:hypothetical protein [Gammaproteobacteria bacterium]
MEFLGTDPEMLVLVEALAREECEAAEEKERLDYQPAWDDRQAFRTRFL